MKILALEFSTEARSVAVYSPGGFAPVTGSGAVVSSESRAVGALTLVAQALAMAGVEREQVGCIAVGTGPGSYTGIRSAIALAQGWELARGVKLLGVGTVDCLAEQLRRDRILGVVTFVIDAQRGEFYTADYEISEHEAALVRPLRITGRVDAEASESAGRRLAGPDVTRWFPRGHVVRPSATVLAELAAARTGFVPGEQLEPIYLREVNFVKAPPPRVLP